MAVVQRDPIAEIRHFVQEKPKQLEASVKAWASKQPAWVEGVVVGLQGSVQVGCGRGLGRRACSGWARRAAHPGLVRGLAL